MNNNGSGDKPISQELLDILRDPLAVQQKEKYGDDPGRLELVRNSWLVSNDTGLKYPIRDGIPIMLIEEGMKWKETAVDDLPVPPPAPETASPPVADSSTPQTVSDERSIALTPPQLIALLTALIAVIWLLRRRS